MRRVIILIVVCTLANEVLCQISRGGDIPHSILSLVEKILLLSDEEDYPEDFSYEELIYHFSSLLTEPLNINRADRSVLESLKILSDREITLILDYVKSFGKLFSTAELYSIPGISVESLNLLLPFISVEEDGKSSIKELLPGSFKAILRGSAVPQQRVGYTSVTKEEYAKNPESRYLGNSFHLYGQMRYDISNRFTSLIIMEKDPGEKGVDYLSWSAVLKGIGRSKRGGCNIEKIIIGSYSARYGQGLVLWNSFHPGNSREPQQSMRREQGIKEYTSADENLAFKGIASTCQKGDFSFTAMASSRYIDARVTDEGYTSLLTTGLHNTNRTVERKESLKTEMAALNLGFNRDRLKLALTISSDIKKIHYSGNNQALINRDRYRSNPISNMGIDWRYIAGKLHLYGEAALDKSGATALLAGFLLHVNEKIVLSYKLEKISSDYVAPLSYSYKSGGKGAALSTLNLKLSIRKPLTLYLKGDISQKEFKFSGMIDYLKSEDNELIFRVHTHQKKATLRGDIKFRVTEGITNHIRLDYSADAKNGLSQGYHFHYELTVKNLDKHVELCARCAFFNISEWNNRIYSYEKEVLYQFKTTVFYGKGLRYYINLKFKPSSKLVMWLRFSNTKYFDRESIGTGVELIKGSSKSEIKIQLQISI